MDIVHSHMPYDNSTTVYSGSADDAALNAGVARDVSDPSVANYMEHYYAPSGDLHVPVITLHTTRDPIVPVSHEPMYAAVVQSAGVSRFLVQRTVDAFGHCAFPNTEAETGAFASLVQWVRTGVKPAN